MKIRLLIVGLLVLGAGQVRAAEVALVMSVQGKVTRLEGAAQLPVEAFVKLKEADRLTLNEDSHLQLVYFHSGRHETWAGSGSLAVGREEGRSEGLAAAQVKTLPMVMVRQLARTPALDSQGRGGVTRLRSLPTADAIGKLDTTYQELKTAAVGDDLGPEMYLLSGLYELRQLDRVEKLLGALQQERPKNPEAALLISLYRKALKNVRESKK